MILNSSGTASRRQQWRCFALKSSAASLSGMKAATPKATRKAKVTDEHRREAERLMELWEARLHDTQVVFGEKYEIGGQSAVGQFLRGEVPLSMKAARGFAQGLQCQISDFSPRLARDAATLGLVAGDEATDLTRLARDEFQLIQLYRGLTPAQKQELQIEANKKYNETRPGASPANPFPNPPPPIKDDDE
jgi:hypothetical protein